MVENFAKYKLHEILISPSMFTVYIQYRYIVVTIIIIIGSYYNTVLYTIVC